MAKAIYIPTDPTKGVEVREFTVGDSYETLRSAVEGYIECVGLAPDLDLWVNEEGKLDGLDYNPRATALWEMVFGNTDVIVGNAILTGGADEEGDTLGLSEEWVESLLTAFAL